VLRPETAQLLRQFADHLEQPRAWYGIDRFVHELLSDLVRDALVVPHVPHGGNAGALTARAVALRVLARHEPLWPGAGSRGISPYSHESLLAVVRLAALAA
jgi:hypothetical protein